MQPIPIKPSDWLGGRSNQTETRMIHDFFDWCVWVLEVIGHQTGWGYELANIIIFVIVEPALILLFFLLWLHEKRNGRRNAPAGLPDDKQSHEGYRR